MKKLRIRLKSFDYRLLDKTVRDIMETTKKINARISGPIPLPTKISRFAVLRSPHVDKKSMETFEMRTHKRIIYIIDPDQVVMEEIGKIDIPQGVDIEIKEFETTS